MLHPTGNNFSSSFIGYSDMLFFMLLYKYAVVLQLKICSVIHSVAMQTVTIACHKKKVLSFMRGSTHPVR